MSIKLRDLIRNVRAQKTAADERAVITKECAEIRTAIRDGKDKVRSRNLSKLIYIHMLGYPTDFAQMETIKLLSSDSYTEKRVGYLALGLLLDERQEVLTLAQNHIKIDLTNRQEHIQTLSLCTIANIAGEDMARDLITEVVQLLDHSNPNLKKKACLSALRIVYRVPEMAEQCLDRLTGMLNERNHGVLLASLALVTHCLSVDEGKSFLPVYRKTIPLAGQWLKNLVMSPYALEHDVQGIADPFLQVRLLAYLRVLGAGDQHGSEQMNDILAQVATNTEGSKNCGSAILYECVKTIIHIESDPGLRVLGVNILGRFLVNRDNNIRYVALNTLVKVVEKDIQAVQRHKNTIVDCLKDVDISIRRRALDLIYTLVNGSNVRMLVPDLINYLSFAQQSEFKEDLTTKICTVVERFAPSAQWHIETLIRVMSLAGPYVPENVANKLIALVSQVDAALQLQSVDKLWQEISQPLDVALMQKESLITAGVWCVGEFSDLLQKQYPDEGQFAENLVMTITNILQSTRSLVVKQYSLNSLLKIAVRFPTVNILVTPTFEQYQCSLEVELQQRAWEYLQLLECGEPEIAASAADRMPHIEMSFVMREDGVGAAAQPAASPVSAVPAAAAVATPTEAAPAPAAVAAPAAAPQPAEGFLDSIFDAPAPTPQPAQPTGAPAAVPAPAQPAPKMGLDLDDLFDGGGAPAGAPAPAPAVAPDVFAPGPAPVQPVQQMPAAQPMPAVQGQMLGQISAFQGANLRMVMNVSRPSPELQHKVNVDAVIFNLTHAPITGVSFMAAVTRTASLEMRPLPLDTIQPGAYITQTMVVDNDNGGNQGLKPIVMKIRLGYVASSGQCNEEFTVSGFPSTR
eukprot:TRINITY_DN32831_c0_g1_i1.p1 TRINITY_DN32831_c0_g1~~TRINITY_DN32831_c0_g1_i1.p1  ORF type:complete len:858 (+),score=292.23 TRINITY_DN32831_c0_g1_i1:143-2716(+)